MERYPGFARSFLHERDMVSICFCFCFAFDQAFSVDISFWQYVPPRFFLLVSDYVSLILSPLYYFSPLKFSTYFLPSSVPSSLPSQYIAGLVKYGKQVENSKRVVVVVGRAHIPGVLYALRHDRGEELRHIFDYLVKYKKVSIIQSLHGVVRPSYRVFSPYRLAQFESSLTC